MSRWAGLPDRWRGLPVTVRDGLLALVLTVVGQLELFAAADQVAGSLPLQHLAFLVMTGSLVWRRSRPLAAVALAAGALAGQTFLGDAPVGSGFVAVLVVTYSVAQYAASRRWALGGLVMILVAVAVYPLARPGEASLADEIINLGIPVLVWVGARLARERLDRAVVAERESAALRLAAREEEIERAAAVTAERRRIAREAHDVVAHGVTLMLLHAEAAQASLRDREPEARGALDVVMASGRSAITDMHRILSVLRDEQDQGSPGRRGLDDIPEMVRRTTTADVRVELTVDGPARALPATVDATAYRIVQEALTNALRHAGASHIAVALRYADDTLHLSVTDDGEGAGTGALPARNGYGLAGVRERVAVFGGDFSAGPRGERSGWEVAAALPLTPVAP